MPGSLKVSDSVGAERDIVGRRRLDQPGGDPLQPGQPVGHRLGLDPSRPLPLEGPDPLEGGGQPVGHHGQQLGVALVEVVEMAAPGVQRTPSTWSPKMMGTPTADRRPLCRRTGDTT